MPELAEVSLYARDLNRKIGKNVLKEVSFLNRNDWGSVVIPNESISILNELVGHNMYFESTGKSLFLYKSKGKTPILEFNLAMSGSFQLQQRSKDWKRHYFLILRFETFQIYFCDPRRFSRVKPAGIIPTSIGGFSRNEGLWFAKNIVVPDGYLSKSKIRWLLDNGKVTGVGNYMANEALGLLGLSPFTPCFDILEAKRILLKCQQVARRSFRYGGNSFGTGYFLLNGDEGGYSSYCKFYGNKLIRKYIFNGRPVYTKFEA